MTLRILLILALFLLLIPISCVQRVERPQKIDFSRYFPLSNDNEYFYSNRAFKATLNNGLNRNLYTFTYTDSSDNILWWEDYLRDESGVMWKNIAINMPEMPAIFFEPPLPFSPWSDLVGDTLFYSGLEIRADSVNSHIPIMVEYEVMAVEDVETVAGLFKDCIQIRRDYKTVNQTARKMLDSESFWWFALDVGVVKYKATEMSFELIRATVDDILYPNGKDIKR